MTAVSGPDVIPLFLHSNKIAVNWFTSGLHALWPITTHDALLRIKEENSQLTTTCTEEILQRVYGVVLLLLREVRAGTLTFSFGMDPV